MFNCRLKRLLSTLLCLVFCLGILPLTALPASPEARALGADAPARSSLMARLALSYTDSSDAWTLLDMAAYAQLPTAQHKSSEAARQRFGDSAIAALQAPTQSSAELAKYELSLRALGVDTGLLYPVNAESPLSIPARLSALKEAELQDQYSAPALLLAEQQGGFAWSNTQRDALLGSLEKTQGDGLFERDYDGVIYPDVDTASTMLAALAASVSTDQRAKALVDKSLLALSRAQGENGSFGNANSDAMALCGLLALGIDPAKDTRFLKSGASLVDGLLSHRNPTQSAFQFAGKDNALATEQAFRALVALEQFALKKGPYNIYLQSADSTLPLRASGSSDTKKPAPAPSTGADIHIKFQMKADAHIWVPRQSITLKEGATVYHALQAALEGRNLSVKGAETGYVSAISQGDVTLAEFSKGPHSGWLYQVNGTAPQMSLLDCTLKDGDEIFWYYSGEPSLATNIVDSMRKALLLLLTL